jgi:formiminoglutamase
MKAFEFELFDPKQRQLSYQKRNGETRVGDYLSDRASSTAKFVLIGIAENIGPLANLGRPGSENAFAAFSKVFFNTQFHNETALDQLTFLGQMKQLRPATDRPDAMVLVRELDTMLYEVLTTYVGPHQIPIVVGGGHNNALPIMRWASSKGKLSVVNIDAHADLRSTDNRHSGNSFSYALQEGLIEQYGVFGLHEAFNNTYLRSQLLKPQVTARFYEDYLQGPYQLTDDVLSFIQHQHHAVGIEIDMDAIAHMPSSACSPSGWSLDQIRSLILKLGHTRPHIAYLNLTEAAPCDDKEDLIVGKALTYLVRDFCSAFK